MSVFTFPFGLEVSHPRRSIDQNLRRLDSRSDATRDSPNFFCGFLLPPRDLSDNGLEEELPTDVFDNLSSLHVL